MEFEIQVRETIRVGGISVWHTARTFVSPTMLMPRQRFAGGRYKSAIEHDRSIAKAQRAMDSEAPRTMIERTIL